MKDNILNTPYVVNPGHTINWLIFENNTIISTLQLKSLYGDIIINNNKREDKEAIVQALGLDILTYIDKNNLKCTFKFKNNIG